MELTLVHYFYYTEQEKENDLLILSILSRKVLLVSGKTIDLTKLVLVDSSSGSVQWLSSPFVRNRSKTQDFAHPPFTKLRKRSGL